jgi:hypothetical protein
MTRALAASRVPSTHRTPPDLRLTNPAIGDGPVALIWGARYLFEVCVSRPSLARAGSSWSCSDRYWSTWWACNGAKTNQVDCAR